MQQNSKVFVFNHAKLPEIEYKNFAYSSALKRSGFSYVLHMKNKYRNRLNP